MINPLKYFFEISNFQEQRMINKSSFWIRELFHESRDDEFSSEIRLKYLASKRNKMHMIVTFRNVRFPKSKIMSTSTQYEIEMPFNNSG